MRTWTKLDGLELPRAGADRITLQCRFLTWVFGGGEQPKKFDRITRVRPPSIRGQLRFWWRATHADLDRKELLLLETALFGGVHRGPPVASAFGVAVSSQPREPARKEVFRQGDAFKLADDSLRALAYGAFPLRGTDAAKTHDVLWSYGDGKFTIDLDLVRPLDALPRSNEGRGKRLAELLDRLEREYRARPTVRSELERAIWAWLHFGGLGGRTRRGFGAVALDRADGFELRSIRDGWPAPAARRHAAWAVLPASPDDAIVEGRPRPNGKEAQEVLLGLLQEVRQGAIGRRENRPRPGRSFWPEPSAIRHIHRMETGKHGQPIPEARVDAFPRSAFGAPIIFHFKTEPGEREPPDSTLVPGPADVRAGGTVKPYGRLASPLVLRPHADASGVRPLALRLEHPSPPRWALVVRKNVEAVVRGEVDASEASRITPLVVDGTTFPDPIDMYLQRLRNR